MNVSDIAARLRDVTALLSGATPELRSSWESWFDSGGYSGRTYAGKTVTQDNAIQLTTVWACISLISDAVASAQPEVYTQGKDGTLTRRTNPAWVDMPNTDMLPYEFRFASTVSALVDGNTFYYIIRTPTGQVQELILLDPASVSVEFDTTGRRVYHVNGEFVDRNHMLHVPGFVIPGEARAVSPIQAARQAIGLGMAAEQYGSEFFSNGASLSGVIEAPGALETNQAKVMAQSFMDNHKGLGKAHLPGVLTGGATWKTVNVPPEQAQFLETRRYQTAEIARLYRVPPHLIGDVERSTSWGTGIEEQNRNFIQYTLSPWTVRFETAWSSLLPRPQVVRYDLSNLLRGTKKERYETYAVGIDGGFILPDEAREAEGLGPLPNGLGSTPRLAPNDSPFTEAPGTTDEMEAQDESQ